MSREYKKALFALFTAVAISGAPLMESLAFADVLSCPSQNGTVRVWDQAVNRCGILSLNNTDWNFIGNPPWNNRIDQFGNDDFIQHRTMCLYDGIQFTGTPVALPPGFRLTWNNTVSSNRWTTSSC